MPSRSKKSRANRSAQPQSNSHSNSANLQQKLSHPSPSPVSVEVNGYVSGSNVELDLRTGDTTESAGEHTFDTTANRKKQKRKDKDAARNLVDQQPVEGYHLSSDNHTAQASTIRTGRGPAKGYFTEEPDYLADEYQDDLAEPDDAFYSGDEDGNYSHDFVTDTTNSWYNAAKRKKGSKGIHNHPRQSPNTSRASSGMVRSTLPALSNAAIRSAHKMSNDQIWNTSTQAERENIKQFWLELGEEERRSLVKVEKEAVLKKMKEQQKHSCSCSVCGRKRTAIEEELEVLYDAYYEELEQFANHNNDLSNGTRIIPPPRSYRSMQSRSHPMAGSFPVSGRIRELGEDGEELDDDEDYEDDEDDEPFSDEDYDDELPPGPPDFFQFGNSLTVKDGILTVADDLLKNDGKHFIDMMEQLAERRMQREEEIHYPAPPLAHQGLRQGHNHPPIDDDDDDYDDEDDEEDYDSQEEDDYEGDEMDSMTEEQRMEEGRRMFQIFAARMFEQRVLTAYREKVAAERQRKLLEELDEESRLDTQREAKKARDAAKKKEKKARQKAAKEEEKAKKDAEKAAQEAAAKAAEEKKAEEQRKKKEEQRKKREAERKAAEEERLRKEAEKQRRAQEERERQADQERKQRETKEKEKKKRDEARKKDREEREARDKEAREKRQQEDEERKALEEQAKKQKEDAHRAEKEAKSKQEQASKPQAVALPPGLHHAQRNAQLQSPHFQVATPVLPANIVTPARNRQPSQPSHTSSPKSQQASTEASQPSLSPSSMVISAPTSSSQPAKSHGHMPQLHHPQPAAPRSPLSNMGRGGQYPYHINGIQGPNMVLPQGSTAMPAPNAHAQPYPGIPPPNQQRFMPQNVNIPPGFGAPRPFHPGQPIAYPQQHANIGAPGAQPQAFQAISHSRQPSGSDAAHQQEPISRPGPIARPASTTPDKTRMGEPGTSTEVDQLAIQLGSKALLDDSDEPIPSTVDSRAPFPPVGLPGSGRTPFASQFHDPKHSNFGMTNSGRNGFGGAMSGTGWTGPPTRHGQNWPQQPFGAINGAPIGRSHAPRPIAVRLMLVHACRRLSAMTGIQTDGFHPVTAILQQLEQQKFPGEPSVSMDEMLAICDTEGSVQNGGGSFEVVRDANGHQLVKYIEDGISGPGRTSLGDIGSPIPVQGSATSFGSIGQGFGPPGRHF